MEDCICYLGAVLSMDIVSFFVILFSKQHLVMHWTDFLNFFER